MIAVVFPLFEEVELAMAAHFRAETVLAQEGGIGKAVSTSVPVLDDLVTLLALERLENNLFRGQSQDLGWGTVYGGQVMGQALAAAARTVPEGRFVHSLHAYFLRPGGVKQPIVYDVDRIRDGGSFTTRRVVAIQNGEAIFNMACSFQVQEEGFDHHDPIPDAPAPESLAHVEDKIERPFDMRRVDGEDGKASRLVWLRAKGKLGDDQAVHSCLLAYVSDYSFVTTSLLPHDVTWQTPGMHVASLDHVMWFHRSFRVDDWLLHAIESPSASGARGIVKGRVFTRAGKLIASTAQEGLIRMRPPK
ncbi:acyl-CoA thioesterase II [soil metagenome]